EIFSEVRSRVTYLDDSQIVVETGENQRVTQIRDKNGVREIRWQDNLVAEVTQLIDDRVVRTISREQDGDLVVWTDNGEVIGDAESKNPLSLLVRIDMEGNVRFIDLSESGRNRPALVMAANGPCHEDGRLQILPGEHFDAALDSFLEFLSLW